MATTDMFPVTMGDPNSGSSNLDIDVQIYVRNTFWQGSTTSLSECTSYFRYFKWTVDTMLWPNASVDKASFAVQTYQDIATVVQCIDKHCNESRAEIAARLQTDFPQSPQDCILRSMDLALRLWMTLHIRSGAYPIGPLLSDVTVIEWKPKQTLHNLVAATFPKGRNRSTVLDSYTSHISPGFNVMSIRKLCRLQVHWTQSLQDHLKLDRSMRRLYIYPHKVCLLNHLERCKVYPRDFLLETLRTLDLLFPYGDKNTEDWLEQNNQPFHRTSSSHIQARATSLEEFRYWRQRLTELYCVYEQPPATIPQMWHDRRNPMQWYTFWLAAFLVVLSIVFGILGTYIGFKQIQLAEKSIRISLGQTD